MGLVITRDHKKRETFDVTIEGVTYNLRKFKHVKPSVLREANKLDDYEGMCFLLDEAAPGIVDALEDQKELKKVIVAWQEDSGVTEGESEAS